jgi:hypothetical protein
MIHADAWNKYDNCKSPIASVGIDSIVLSRDVSVHIATLGPAHMTPMSLYFFFAQNDTLT